MVWWSRVNTGLLLEVLIVSFVLISLVYLFTLHYFSLSTLLLNERESRRILSALILSDYYISDLLAVTRMGIKTNNLVDCEKLRPEENLYLRCDNVRYGDPEGKLRVTRTVVYRGKKTLFEVGIP
jgi:hypothetical protein